MVGTRGLIIKSTDGGITWTSLNSGIILPLHGVRYLDLNNAVAVGDSLTILKTTDGGTLWRNRRPAGIPGALLGRKLLSVNFSSSTAGYAVGEGGVYMRSTDGGENWTLQTSFATTSTELRSVYFADQLTGWAVGWSNAPPPGAGIIFRTIDGGSSWSQLFTGGTTQNLNSVAFQTDGQGIVVGSGGIILKALNGGAAPSDWSFQPKGHINVGVIDGSKRFVVLGLPLHLLDGSGTVKDFLRHVILDEFGP